MFLPKPAIRTLILITLLASGQFKPCLAQISTSPINDQSSDLILKGNINTTDPTTAVNQIDELTRQILLKIVQLERFNIHYSMEVAKQGRWKGWRYAAFQEVNAGMGLAGAIIGTANRGSHLRTPARVWTVVQQSACFIPMIGSIIGASAAALELSINEYHDIQASRKGFAPKTARNYVKKIVDEIDALLDKRDQLIAIESTLPSLSGHVKIDTAEGKVIEDLRDQAVLEFVRFQINARRLLAFQQAQYFFDLSKYTLNAIGYEFAYLSLHRHRRIWNFRAGVMFDIAGPIYMGAPILSRLIGKGVGEMHKHLLFPLTNNIKENDVQALQNDYNELNKLCQDNTCAPPNMTAAIDRQEIYKLQNHNFQDEIRRGLKQDAKAKLTATQNVGAGFFVGSLKLAQGILFTVPGYYTAYNSKTLKAAQVTNTDLFVGSVLSIPGGAFAMADTLRIQVQGEINRHKLLKLGEHPTQIATRRLHELDEIEHQLTKYAK